MEKNNEFKLLPNGAKKVGLGISITVLLIVVLLRVFNIKFPAENADYYKDMLLNGILLGLFIIAFSKEKIEDERVRAFRYKSMASALVFGVIITILRTPMYLYIFNDAYEPHVAQELLFAVILWHLIIFSKLRYEKQGKNEYEEE